VKRSRLALVAAVLGALGVFDVLVGPLLIHLGVISPIFGFQWFFGLGLLEGVAALALGLVALWTTRGGRASGRSLAWAGTACGAALTALLFLGARQGAGLPRINDITTDLDDPPAFAGDPSARARDMSYAEGFAAQVRAAYPDLRPIHVSSDPGRALDLAGQTARELGWQVVSTDQANGTMLARQTSTVFMFVDDIVVRVRPLPPGGSVVDVRSKSRDGRGDLGANARRIRAFAEALPR
jgi:uncharacterized protein (DUF1499 family)